MTEKPVRVRYAPSPTGFLHVGGARTALYNYLLARQTGGSFIIRIEDTDQKRYNPQSVSDLLDSLRYLGLTWDEGPEVGGNYGPYYQTQRLDIYQPYIRQLLDQNHAYRCFCTAERLAALAEEQQQTQQAPGYDRTCRNIPVEDSDRRAAAGEPFVVRLKTPLEGNITMPDAIRGNINLDYTMMQDTVLVKSNGIPTYHFAVVIDDHLMEITHVLRGEEWLSSFGIHTHLYHCFGWQPPIFAHLPVILNPAGKGKMSKREDRAPDGTLFPVFVHTFKAMGYLPETLINYLALVGWSFDDKTEIMTRDELIARFSIDRVNASPAAWNYEKLDHFNGLYIRNLTPADLADRLLPFVRQAGLSPTGEQLLKIVPLIQERLVRLTGAADQIDFFFADTLPDYDLNLLVPKKMTLADIPPLLKKARAVLAEASFTHHDLDAALRHAAEELGIKPGQFLQPIRLAVSGKQVSPPLFGTLEVLGREATLKRIDDTLIKLS